MSGWAAAAGIVDKALGFASSAQAQHYSRKNMRLADKLSVKNYKNRYQWTTQDMRKAGLNPVLAASGGFSVSGNPTISPVSGAQPHPGESMTTAFSNMARAKKDEAQAEEAKAKTEKLSKEVDNILADTAKKKKETAKIVQEIINMKRQYEKLAAEIQKTKGDSKRSQALGNQFKQIDDGLKNMFQRLDKMVEWSARQSVMIENYIKSVWSGIKLNIKDQ